MKVLSFSVRTTSNTEMALNEIYLIMQNKQNPVAIVQNSLELPCWLSPLPSTTCLKEWPLVWYLQEQKMVQQACRWPAPWLSALVSPSRMCPRVPSSPCPCGRQVIPSGYAGFCSRSHVLRRCRGTDTRSLQWSTFKSEHHRFCHRLRLDDGARCSTWLVILKY